MFWSLLTLEKLSGGLKLEQIFLAVIICAANCEGIKIQSTFLIFNKKNIV